MVVKVYISGISGNKEVKKRQQRVLLILESKNIKYELLDIAEPNMEDAKEYMQNNSKLNGGTISDPNPRHPLPPQIFNDDEYCGDYDAFDMANEIDEMEKFLKLSLDDISSTNSETKLENGALNLNGKDSEITEEVEMEKSPSPTKERAPSPQKEKSSSPTKERSPSPQKEKSSSPQREKSLSPIKDDILDTEANETDDQKAENVSKEENNETEKDIEETEKSDE